MRVIMERVALPVTSILISTHSSRTLEISTSQTVAVYEKPLRPQLGGNVKLGELPANVTLPVDKEVIGKDMTAYEVEYEPGNGVKLRDRFCLGVPG
jgi:hypothetical protein